MIGVNGKKGGTLYYSPTADQYVKIGKAWRANSTDGYDVVYTSGYLNYVTGSLPLELKYSKGKPLVNWSITGNTVQDGTPTPEKPVEVKMVGEKTGNLFDGVLLAGYVSSADFSTYGGTTDLRYKTVKVFLKAGTYTIKFGTPVQIVRFVFDNTIVMNVAINKDIYTFTTQTDNYVGLGFRNYEGTDWDTKTSIMLNSGTEPLPYEPYGYKLPVVTRGKNLCNKQWSKNGYWHNGVLNPNIVSDLYWHLDYIEIPDGMTEARISVKEGFTLATGHLRFMFFDDNKNYMSQQDIYYLSRTATIPSGTKFIVIQAELTSAKNISEYPTQIESGYTATTFEPYHESITTNLYLPTPMVKGEVLRSDGSRDVKWGVKVFDGSESFSRYPDYTNDYGINNFRLAVTSSIRPMAAFSAELFCSHFIQSRTAFADTKDENALFSGSKDPSFYIRVKDSKIQTYTQLKSWLKSQYDAGTPVTVYYKLDTPTTEQITNLPEIPTIKPTTIIDVDTEVKPESMTATYKSSKPDTAMAEYLSLYE